MPALRAGGRRHRSGTLNHRPARNGGVLAAVRLLAVASFLGLALAATAAPGDFDRFVAGASVTERAPVDGDLFAAAGSVDVEAPVAGDAVVAGGTVRLGADVGRSVYAAGGRLTLVGRVAHNARLAGGQVQIEAPAHVAGNLTVTAGRVELLGTVDGSVGAAGGHVRIDGRIGGDVDVAAGSIELGPNARIDGSLRYRSSEPLQRDPTAQVTGTIERLGAESAEEAHERPMRWIGTAFAVLWTIGLALLAAIAVAVAPRASAAVSQALHRQPGFALLLGFIVLVCTPIAAVLAFVTVIGIPLGLLALLVYLMLLPVAWIVAAVSIGDWFVTRLPSSEADAVMRRVVAAVLAVVLLAFLARVPWVGGWIAFVALMAGLGALALQMRRLLPG